MKLEIEIWSEKNLADNAKILMEESVSCYKIGAYRSAYIMSYLAFKQTIRERIIKAPAWPECFVNNIEWERNVLKLLKDDDKWEENLNNIIEANPKKNNKFANIFQLSNREVVLVRYNYWRAIRNSCAHAKEEHIDSSTVEQFWNYIRDDLSKFYVLGGKNYLMRELIECYKYYDCDKKDISHLLKDVKILYESELKEFFKEFLDNLMEVKRHLINSKNIKFWEQIIFNKEDIIKNEFVISICEKQEMFLDFYNYFHCILEVAINYNKKFIKDYINPLLCEDLSNSHLYKKYFWKILSGSLAKNPEVIDIKSITSNYDNFILINDIDIDYYEKLILDKYKIFNEFILNSGKDMFKNDSDSHWNYYSYENNKDDSYIIKCFDYIEWNIEMLEKIESSYEELKNSIDMRSNLDSRINGHTRIKLYKEIITRNKDKIEKSYNNIDLEKYPNVKMILDKVYL
ncbi:hypothetical protein ACOT7R_07070 [Clostridium perfringens]|uniref:hypothetical protein n=1 Tax=Clostridium perfringens TaxID=1502 RepID=UPI003BADAB82